MTQPISMPLHLWEQLRLWDQAYDVRFIEILRNPNPSFFWNHVPRRSSGIPVPVFHVRRVVSLMMTTSMSMEVTSSPRALRTALKMDGRCLSIWSCWSGSRVDQLAIARPLNNSFIKFSVQPSDEGRSWARVIGRQRPEMAWSSSRRKNINCWGLQGAWTTRSNLTNLGVDTRQKVRHGGIAWLPRRDHKPAPCSDGDLQHDLDKARLEVQIRAYAH